MHTNKLFLAETWHGRFSPKRYQFWHKLFLFGLDLDELTFLNNLKLFKIEKKGYYAFFDQDFFPTQSDSNLKNRVLQYCQQHDSTLEISRVYLLAQPRVLGFCYNPVSFYFCYNAQGQAVCAAADVHNTFFEHKLFYIPLNPNTEADYTLRQVITKYYYVSPFSSVDEQFEFLLNLPEETLDIRVNTLNKNNERILGASLKGSSYPLSDETLLKLTLKHPFVPLQTLIGIHAHAFVLWLKRLPFYAKEANTEKQIGVLHPHKSLVK